MTKFAVMRRPVLMEDEGRHFLEVVRDSRKECEQWIVENTKPGDYFHKGDYYIMQER